MEGGKVGVLRVEGNSRSPPETVVVSWHCTATAHDLFFNMNDLTLLDIVRGVPLFSELDLEDLMMLTSSCALKNVAKGTLLFQEGELYRGMYVVVEGSVKVYRLTPEGKETILHVLFPKQTLAEIPMFAGSDYPANAEALEATSLLFVSREGFLELIRRDMKLALKMLAGLSKRLRVLATQLEELTVHDVRSRLVNYLLGECDGSSVVPVVRLRVSKSVLAATLGTTLETLSRSFRKLEDEGCLEVKGRKVFLNDIGKLRGSLRGQG